MPAPELPWTGERLVPSYLGDTAIEHLHRYALALDFARGRDVLDLACGEGYGSNILSRSARSVIGVDISETVVAHAQRKYGRDAVRFAPGSGTDIPLPDDAVDLVVSFETLEHIADHDRVLGEFRRVLRPGGVLVISTPDKLNYTILPRFANDHHVLELSRRAFFDKIGAVFAHTRRLEQSVFHGSIIAPVEGEEGAAGVREFLGSFDKLAYTDGLTAAPYCIAIAADAALAAPSRVDLFRGWDIPTELEKQLGNSMDEIARLKHEIEDLRTKASGAPTGQDNPASAQAAVGETEAAPLIDRERDRMGGSDECS